MRVPGLAFLAPLAPIASRLTPSSTQLNSMVSETSFFLVSKAPLHPVHHLVLTTLSSNAASHFAVCADPPNALPNARVQLFSLQVLQSSYPAIASAESPLDEYKVSPHAPHLQLPCRSFLRLGCSTDRKSVV